MKPIKQFKIGSSVFFEQFEDYNPKDIDELCIMDEFIFPGNSIHTNGLQGKDVFFYRNISKEEFIKDCRDSNLPMTIGKFLVPEFVEYINFTIDDLKQLKDIIDQIDKKHDYEKIIYNAYIENNGFWMNNEQLTNAYNKYLEIKKGDS